MLDDDFTGPELDRSVWLPHYLPAWSSRARTAATYEVAESRLRLSIPPAQGLWCAGDHHPDMRVSAVQSGSFSGPVGSTVGQQPYREGLTVREEQPTFWGCTPQYGRIEVRARLDVRPGSMAAFWLVGLEDRPERSAEICVMEVFGDAVEPGRSAAVGMGLHAFRDPDVVEDFAAVRLPIDVAEPHDYAVDWTPDRAELRVDGAVMRTVTGPPRYPVQLMLGVFDFPGERTDREFVPALEVDRVLVRPLP